MKKITILFALAFAYTTMAMPITRKEGKTQTKAQISEDEVQDSVQYFKTFADSLQKLIDTYKSADNDNVNSGLTTNISPYFYQLITPGTFYLQPIRQILTPNWKVENDREENIVSSETLTDAELSRLYYSHQALGSMYTFYPSLISVTEDQLTTDGKVVNDVDVPIKYEKNEQVDYSLAELEQEEVGQVDAIVRKPNFWTLKGSNSLDLTQNYATDNWFQGKANHYNVQGIIAVEANFNNKRKIQWDNRLDLQLGFQTNQDNEYQKFKPTNNLVRINTKLGIKAAKNWNYALSVKAESQLVPNNNYDKNGNKSCITDFLSPLNVDVALGIDWKWNLKRFSGSLMLAPGTYNFKYVDRIDLAGRYLGSDRKEHHSKHTFGPSATARFNWKIANNISWDSRLYWITNLHYTNIEFENTITFSINKYLTSKFYFYPRFNDTSIKNRMPDDEGKNTGTYWMFKEWLSLGVSYNW